MSAADATQRGLARARDARRSAIADLQAWIPVLEAGGFKDRLQAGDARRRLAELQAIERGAVAHTCDVDLLDRCEACVLEAAVHELDNEVPA